MIGLLLCTTVFGVVCALYNLPLEAVGYGAVLCTALGGAMAAVRRIRLARRRDFLRRLLRNVQDEVLPLPEPKLPLEAEYQALVQAVCQDRTRRTAAEEAHRQTLLDDFTLWAHQVKTPLSAMALLLDEPGTPSVLGAELVQLSGCVDMALTCLRLDGDSTDFVFRSCALDDLIREAAAKYARLFIQKEIALDFCPTEKVVVTDGKWLGFVLEQLLSNALKYTPPGGRIRVFRDGETLVIADTGAGIPPDELPRIFEKGYTGSTGRTDQQSSGLGLYLCRRVLDKLGLAIVLTSHPGQGTAARITLPSTAPPQD